MCLTTCCALLVVVVLCSTDAATHADPLGAYSTWCLYLPGDRTRHFHTKLPVNQAYLNQIAAPPEVAVLTPVFEQLAQAEREGKLPPLRIAVGRSL